LLTLDPGTLHERGEPRDVAANHRAERWRRCIDRLVTLLQQALTESSPRIVCASASPRMAMPSAGVAAGATTAYHAYTAKPG
jgi:hypothetical protein